MIVRELLIGLGVKASGARKVLSLEVNLKNYTKSAKSATRETKSLSSAFKGLIGPLAAVGTALAGLNLGKTIVSTIASAEKLQVQLQQIYAQDLPKAAAAFEVLNKFAAETPFRIDDITRGFIQLKRLGVEPTRQEMTKFGDVAAAYNMTFGELSDVVRQTLGGSTEVLMERFGVIAGIMGNQIKITREGFDPVIIKRSSRAIMDYLLAMGDLKEVQGGMLRQSKTLTGLWSTFEDQMSGFIRQMGEGGLLDALHEFMTVLMGTTAGSKEFAKQLGGALAKGLRFATQAFKLLIESVKSLGFVGDMAKEIFVGFGKGIGLIDKQTGTAADGFIRLADAILYPFELMEDFFAFMSGRKASALAHWVDANENDVGENGVFARAFKWLRDDLPASLGAASEKIGEVIRQLLKFGPSVKVLWGAIKTIITGFATLDEIKIWEGMDAFLGELDDFITRFNKLVGKLVSDYASWLDETISLGEDQMYKASFWDQMVEDQSRAIQGLVEEHPVLKGVMETFGIIDKPAMAVSTQDYQAALSAQAQKEARVSRLVTGEASVSQGFLGVPMDQLQSEVANLGAQIQRMDPETFTQFIPSPRNIAAGLPFIGSGTSALAGMTGAAQSKINIGSVNFSITAPDSDPGTIKDKVQEGFGSMQDMLNRKVRQSLGSGNG